MKLKPYWELNTNCLIAGEILPFDVYILREGKTVLWRGKSTEVTQKDIVRLANSGVESVLIGINNKEKYLNYIEPNALELIRNNRISLEYKSYVVRETTNRIIDELYKTPTEIGVAKRLEKVVTGIVELILSSSNMAPLKFLIDKDNLESSYAPHSARTCYYTVALASSYKKKFSKDILKQIAIASLLHDIGQMIVKPEIRKKTGKYTDEERCEMEKHPIYSVNLIKRSEIYDLDDTILMAIKSHHELGDKTGYPQHISLFDLPFEARLLALTHTFESYTIERVHRKARKFYDVIRFILSNPSKYPLDIARQFVHVLSILDSY